MENYREPACLYDGQRRLYREQRLLSDDRRIPSSRFGFLNSSPLIWYSEITNMNKTGVGDAQVGAQNIILFPIPKQTQKDGEITSVVNSLLNEYSEENANRLQNLIYDVFGLTNEESDYLSKMNL